MNKVLLSFLVCLTTISCEHNTIPNTENNYYDFSRVTKIKTLGTFQVKSTRHDRIVFDMVEGDISDKDIFDRGDTTGFNIDMLYRCKFQRNKNYYYFRMYWQDVLPGPTTSLYVHWEPSAPSILDKEAVIDIVDVPFIQKGYTSVCTIGDSQTWLFHGEDYRYYWSELNYNFSFIGNRTDYWGFGHEGEGGNTSQEVVNRMATFKKADIYVLLIGTNDGKSGIPANQTLENISSIVTHLNKVNRSARIYILTLLPRTEVGYDTDNQFINTLIRQHFQAGANNTFVLDTERIFREQKNWSTLFTDGLHPNDAGYRLLTDFLNKNVK